jgi:hypothetical protein
MSTDTALAGMPTNKRKEILWSRKGLPPEFFGEDLIAEALFEALQTMDRSTMDGFVHFTEAFRKHRFGLDNIVIEAADGCISPSCWLGRDEVNLSLLGLEHVWGIGTFDTEYGIEDRSVKTMPALEDIQEWWTAAKLDEAILADKHRYMSFGGMPRWQVSHMKTKRVFLTQSGQVLVIDVKWEAAELDLVAYRPTHFRCMTVTFSSLYNAQRIDSILRLMNDYSLQALMAVLYGLKLALQSSNYRLRKELEPNEKAEKMLAGLLAQANS